MKVQDVMTATVQTVSPDSPVKHAIQLMMASRVRALPVVDQDQMLLGIITESDIVDIEARAGRASGVDRLLELVRGRRAHPPERVRTLMSAPVETASPEESVRSVARRMVSSRRRHLPVTTGGRLVGIISRWDVMTMFHRSDEAIATEVREVLRRNLYVSPDAEIEVRVADGVVHLSGRVLHHEDARVVDAMVSSLDGVLGVESQIESEMA